MLKLELFDENVLKTNAKLLSSSATTIACATGNREPNASIAVAESRIPCIVNSKLPEIAASQHASFIVLKLGNSL